MNHRLAPLQLLPPRAFTSWSPGQLNPVASAIKRPDGAEVPVQMPLFWYQPAWIRLQPALADRLAAAVAGQDVMVSALRRDLQTEDDPIELMRVVEPAGEDDASETDAQTDVQRPIHLPRMTPYRIERYGLLVEDFDGAQVIDVRLSPSRDGSGRLAYSPDQMSRWERPAENEPVSGGGYVAVSSFPPDVVSLKQLAVKLDQLRMLAPTAAVLVSIGPFHLEEEISSALVSQPDGLIIRFDEARLSGLELAGQVRRVRQLMDEHQAGDLPLWVVPGPISADDVVKLIALGANAVAVDSWCNALVDQVVESMSASAYDRLPVVDIAAMTSAALWYEIDRVVGLLSTLPAGDVATRLGTFQPDWANACGASLLR
ncbi:hypothetical protein FYK55_22425 [Roseiconus nitratireducens]|uniref:Uncharacterized protein n=1 Tax=Roseiconus nitratireducens TaxID=2605748 RepID=A0A5M6CXX0_9BACT|nr:hypothetical protein [Roseiconus nitratireducens]KAA5540068.1 hypothetical protein FYK55_22425 [Roseiconus nitratireducens]